MSDSMNLESLFGLKGKTAVVTGGSRGIGFMIARGLLEAGARVYITARKAQPCEQAAQELSQWGECIAAPADVTSEPDRLALRDRLEAEQGKLHILVNNAGTAWGAPYEEFPQSGFARVMETNVNAMFCLTRDLTPLLEAAGSADDPARVINIGSMEGLHVPSVHTTGSYAYPASKAAVHHLTRHLAVDLGGRGITVNAVAPGFYPSQMTSQIFDQQLQQVQENSPLGRVGKAQEMAGIAVYLSGRAGAYTSGAIIPVDGATSINHQHMRSPWPEQFV